MGQSGFTWWLGVVENRNDPLKMCRCQIRIFGWHTDNLKLIPSKDLPWAQPVFPVNNAMVSKAPKEGEYVVGFFLDGESGQFPAYFGVIPGIPTMKPDQAKGFSDQRTKDEVAKSPSMPGVKPALYPNILDEPTTSRIYRHENVGKTVIGREGPEDGYENVESPDGEVWKQPSSSYAAVPPFDYVLESESGHVMEFDDTKGAERVHLAHRTGTNIEMRADGSKVTRVKGANYEIVAGNDYCNIYGDCRVTIEGGATLLIKGDYYEHFLGDVHTRIDGQYIVEVLGNIDVEGQNNMSLKAAKIDLN